MGGSRFGRAGFSDSVSFTPARDPTLGQFRDRSRLGFADSRHFDLQPLFPGASPVILPECRCQNAEYRIFGAWPAATLRCVGWLIAYELR